MKRSYHGFSLIELIVGVSLSVILMMSVGIFVSSGMKNITIQKQILNESNEITNLSSDFNDILSADFEIISNTTTGILIKSSYINGKNAYYHISATSSTGYCENEPDLETKQLSIENFNPFFLTGVAGYSGSFLDHGIYSGSSLVVGKNIFGNDELEEEILGSNVYLNNPSSLTNSGTLIFVSDSGNNRILTLSGNQVSTLLGLNHGIFAPTGILLNAQKLYILNSGKKELLALSSASNANASGDPIDMIFSPSSNINAVKKFTIEVFPNTFNLIGSYNSGSFTFTNISTGAGDTGTGINNILDYNFNVAKNFLSGTPYSITVPITGILNTGEIYYVKLSLWDNTSSLLYEQYFPYLVNGDNDLTTLNDNTLTILTGGLSKNYTNITLSGANLLLSDYLAGEYLELTKTGAFVGTGTLTPFDMNMFENTKTLSNFKIKDFQVTQVGNLLNIKLEYYKKFDCYNEKDAIVKTLLIKKVIQ